jgi:hypothetical protein
VSPDGSAVFVTGDTYRPTDEGSEDQSDYTTLAYDAMTGEEIWVARYDGPLSLGDVPRSLAVSPDGSMVFVSGGSVTETQADFATLAYDAATGEEIWFASFDGPDSLSDFAYSLEVSPGGRTVFVTGYSLGLETNSDFLTLAYSLVLLIEIDIKPGGFPNSINPGSRGVIPVALLGSEDIDPTDVDVTTLRFGPTEAAPDHSGQLEDVNYDGIMDLVVHFRTQETGIQCGDTEAILTGSLLTGVLLEGTDSIRTIGCQRSSGLRGALWDLDRVQRAEGRVIEPKLEDSDGQE